jgi:uncharacterized protein involved in exopolysaccharide biosynthesis
MSFHGPDFPNPIWILAVGFVAGGAFIGLLWLLLSLI